MFRNSLAIREARGASWHYGTRIAQAVEAARRHSQVLVHIQITSVCGAQYGKVINWNIPNCLMMIILPLRQSPQSTIQSWYNMDNLATIVRETTRLGVFTTKWEMAMYTFHTKVNLLTKGGLLSSILFKFLLTCIMISQIFKLSWDFWCVFLLTQILRHFWVISALRPLLWVQGNFSNDAPRAVTSNNVRQTN